MFLYLLNIIQLDASPPLRQKAVLGMQLINFIFCQLLVMFSVNFDLCSIAFKMYLLNGVPFQFRFSCYFEKNNYNYNYFFIMTKRNK